MRLKDLRNGVYLALQCPDCGASTKLEEQRGEDGMWALVFVDHPRGKRLCKGSGRRSSYVACGSEAVDRGADIVTIDGRIYYDTSP